MFSLNKLHVSGSQEHVCVDLESALREKAFYPITNRLKELHAARQRKSFIFARKAEEIKYLT